METKHMGYTASAVLILGALAAVLLPKPKAVDPFSVEISNPNPGQQWYAEGTLMHGSYVSSLVRGESKADCRVSAGKCTFYFDKKLYTPGAGNALCYWADGHVGCDGWIGMIEPVVVAAGTETGAKPKKRRAVNH